MEEETLLMLKPDALALDIQDELEKRLDALELHIKGKTQLSLSQELMTRWLPWAIEEDWFPTYVCFMLSAPVEIWLIIGDNAISKLLRLKTSMREKYAKSDAENILHCPASSLEVALETSLFIPRVIS